MSWLRTTGYTAFALALTTAAGVVAALWMDRDIPAARLEAKYVTPGSRFLHVDGVRIHYRDEGHGPAILLLHANFGHLFSWDPWVAALQDRYRVVRFDFPAFGLTGPDPGGDYSTGRTLELTERIVDALDLKRFVIAGTSLGGEIAIRYASRHPERIDRLILLTPEISEAPATAQSGMGLPVTARLLEHITPRALAADMLRSHAGDPGKITDEQIDRWWELWRREGNRHAMLERLRAHDGSDLTNALSGVRSPVLVLRGETSPQPLTGQTTTLLDLLKNAPVKQLVTYPGAGRPLLEEAGEKTAGDVRAWLEGRLAPSTRDWLPGVGPGSGRAASSAFPLSSMSASGSRPGWTAIRRHPDPGSAFRRRAAQIPSFTSVSVSCPMT